MCQGFENRNYAKLSTKKSYRDSLNLASGWMCSRTMTLLVGEGLISHCDVRLAACLRANVRPAQPQQSDMLESKLLLPLHPTKFFAVAACLQAWLWWYRGGRSSSSVVRLLPCSGRPFCTPCKLKVFTFVNWTVSAWRCAVNTLRVGC